MALENIQELWTHAPPGNLSALEQCKAWALREVAKDAGEDVNMALVARKLKVKGGGKPLPRGCPPIIRADGRGRMVSWEERVQEQTRPGPGLDHSEEAPYRGHGDEPQEAEAGAAHAFHHLMSCMLLYSNTLQFI